MTTKREKIRKLRALAKSPNKHEAAYFVSRDRRSKHQIKIEIIEYELFNG